MAYDAKQKVQIKTEGAPHILQNSSHIIVAVDEDVIEISKRLIEQNTEAYEVLAK